MPKGYAKDGVKARRWTDDEIKNTLMVYIIEGTLTATAEKTGVPFQTIHRWLNTEKGNQMLEETRKEHQKELDAMYTRLIHKIGKEAEDRALNGNYVMVKGELARKPADLKELMISGAIAFDKRALGRGDPTSRSESVTAGKRLQGLSRAFRDLADQDQKRRLEASARTDTVLPEPEKRDETPTEEPAKIH